MLTYLGIHQISLVESARLDFSAGLNVLSGESGAGKSVVLDALAFVAGAQRPRCQLRAGQKSGHVEAQFSLGLDERRLLSPLFGSLDLEADDELILCRRLDANGRSRCFVQGTLVPLRTLAEIGSLLLEFSDQGDSHALKSPAAQLELLDACSGLGLEAQAFGARYERFRLLTAECERQQARGDEAERRRDFLEFQLNELEACGASEFSEAERRLESSEAVLAVHDFCHGLELETLGGDRSLVERLESWDRRLARLPLAIDSGLGEALAAAVEGLHRLGQLAARLREGHEVPRGELAELTELVEKVRDVARKHRVQPSELEARALSLRAEHCQVAAAEGVRKRLEIETSALRASLLEEAEKLHAARVHAAGALGRGAESALEGLGLPGARLELTLSRTPLGPHGTSELEVAFAGHAGSELRPLGKVASGGELGRVLLALRLATPARRPLLVLDEIDAGAGGRAAAQIGASLSLAAERGQVLCVTHWPQVACRADMHWVVTKTQNAGSARSELGAVQGEAQLNELCRMLGGEAATARAHAQALIDCRDATPTGKPKKRTRGGATAKRKLRLVKSAA